MDIVCPFRTADSGIVGAYEACLTGETIDGTPFGDCDPLKSALLYRKSDQNNK